MAMVDEMDWNCWKNDVNDKAFLFSSPRARNFYAAPVEIQSNFETIWHEVSNDHLSYESRFIRNDKQWTNAGDHRIKQMSGTMHYGLPEVHRSTSIHWLETTEAILTAIVKGAVEDDEFDDDDGSSVHSTPFCESPQSTSREVGESCTSDRSSDCDPILPDNESVALPWQNVSVRPATSKVLTGTNETIINERISKNKAQHYHPKKRNGTNSSPSRNFQGRILRDSFNYQAPSQTEAELRNKCSLYGKRQEMPPAQPTTKPRRHSRGAKAVRSTIMMQTSTNSSESAPSGTGVFRPQLHLITQRK